MREVVSDKQSWKFPEGYEIAPGRTTLRALGGGNRYEVYLVWDERHFSVMVAKILRPDLADDEHALRALRRETEALEALAHPVLLRGFDAYMEGPHPHVVVEHLEGPTLKRLIKRNGRLPVEQTLPLGLHVASVIHYMAEEGWVHLDLKPDNIVMGIPPRVIDMSLARTLERARRLTDYVGTNAYMPPEQCVPRGDVGSPADVWGLGATLYQAIAGRLPFSKPRSRDDDDPPEERFPQLTEEPKAWPVSVPEPLSDAVMACLRRDPEARPTAAEFAMTLQPLVADLPKKLVLGRRGPRVP
jgi:eukaryotic-like serine/threonine-protein kinase